MWYHPDAEELEEMWGGWHDEALAADEEAEMGGRGAARPARRQQWAGSDGIIPWRDLGGAAAQAQAEDAAIRVRLEILQLRDMLQVAGGADAWTGVGFGGAAGEAEEGLARADSTRALAVAHSEARAAAAEEA
eukprot:COSAG04_NODE_13904_length_587_cov_2.454918_1_plen_132_part_01